MKGVQPPLPFGQPATQLVNVELASLARHGRDVAEVLVEATVGEDTLLVMGAYGHWRWREQVLGGTTQYVLHHTKVPVLMSH